METQRRPRPRSIHEDLDDLMTRAESNEELDNSDLEKFKTLLSQARELTQSKSKLARRHSIAASLPLRENKWKEKYAQGVNLCPLNETLSLTKEPSGTSLKVEEESKENPNKVDLVSPESETQSHSISPPSSSYSVSPYLSESFRPDKSELVISVMSCAVSKECLIVAGSLTVPHSALTELSSTGF
uniref:Uncharacterized protein n=1 Tax=Amphimedon queenslandica TaxID=400682 RepID=A0A1X7TVG0_AMPQE